MSGNIELDKECLKDFEFSNKSEANQEFNADAGLLIGFQKNYPKNIFIPIIEFLSDIGLKSQYEKCVGTRQLYEGKNVVSLSQLHRLLSQDFFVRNVEKTILIRELNNKILLNSKIKKKIFHIRVAQLVLQTPTADFKQFKKIISKGANLISQQQIPHDELFQFPNISIYLLHYFVKLCQENLLPRPEMPGLQLYHQQNRNRHVQLSDDSDNSRQRPNSKEQHKFYIKMLVRVFNSNLYSKQQFSDLLIIVRESLQNRSQEIATKFNLSDLHLIMPSFFTLLVERCFRFRREMSRLNNSILNGWISEYRLAATSVKEAPMNEMMEEHKELHQIHYVKDFCPIVLRFGGHYYQ